MTAFVQISHNKIARLSTAISVTTTDGSNNPVSLGPNDFPARNAFYGGSTVYWQNSDTTGVRHSIFRLTIGSDYATEKIDHVAIRGLNLMFKGGSGNVDIEVRGSTDNFASSNVQLLNDTGITAADLVGPFLEDYIFTGVLSAAYRYYKITITSTNSVPHRIRKINIGTLFTFGGKSPYYPYTPGYGDNGTPFTADAGSVFKTSIGRRPRQLDFSWRGITDDLRIEFDKDIRQSLCDYPIFLYEPSASDHSPLNGDTLVYGWAGADVGTKEWKDNNQITLSLREDIVG